MTHRMIDWEFPMLSITGNSHVFDDGVKLVEADALRRA